MIADRHPLPRHSRPRHEAPKTGQGRDFLDERSELPRNTQRQTSGRTFAGATFAHATLARARSAATLIGAAAIIATLAMPSAADAAATITILNGNAPGVGFNDPTPVAPVGGNTGTTLGQQRLIAFQRAADIWGAQLTSTVEIKVLATFEPLGCNATSATLGSANPITVSRSFPQAPFADTWYHAALANALSGFDRVPPPSTSDADLRARFNVNLGQPNCLAGAPFYLGLDANEGPGIDLVAVLLHEFGHGLGFSTTTSGATGAQLGDAVNGFFPSAYDHFLIDQTQNLLWINMTNAQRAASAINTRRLSWNGANVTANVPNVLSPGTPELTATAPASIANIYLIGVALFGPPLTASGLSGEVMPVVDQANGTGLACAPLTGANAVAVNGKIALIDRGICPFTEKVKSAQNAGAIGVIIVDNIPGSPPPDMPGVDPTITIPSVRITTADGNTFKNALRFRSRTKSGVFVTMQLNLAVYAGADPLGRALMYTPNPFAGGSSVSHFDTSARPNLLMEPSFNRDLTHSVIPPQDLSFPLMRDLGWNP
jgi:hypothetical protein